MKPLKLCQYKRDNVTVVLLIVIMSRFGAATRLLFKKTEKILVNHIQICDLVGLSDTKNFSYGRYF